MFYGKKSQVAYIISIALFCCLKSGVTQNNPMVEQAVYKFFENLNTKDTAELRAAFMPHAHMSSVYTHPEKGTMVRNGALNEFVNGIGEIDDKTIIEERISNLRVLRDGKLAHTWMDYAFYVNNSFSHCGTNAIHWVSVDGKWRIESLTDTRYKKKCLDGDKQAVNDLVKNWHRAAATADEEQFFGSMTADAIYLGTDKTERWLRDELKIWSKRYFDRDTAWDFKPSDRHVYFSSDRNTAWWEELLDTWMGDCRGSGVAQKVNGEWKIVHYHLSVTIDNDKIDGFKELIGTE